MSEAFWTRARKAELKRLWDAGHTGAEIAAILKHGLSRAAVCGMANRIGLRRPPDHPNRPRADRDKIKAAIIEAQAHDQPATVAALRLGLSADRTRKWACTFGMPFPARNAGTKGQRWRVSTVKPSSGTRDRKSVKGAHQAPLRLPEAPPRLRPPDNAIGLMELRDATPFGPGTCKWPVNDGHPFLFCGHKTAGTVYCGYHARLAYAPRSRRDPLEAAE